MRRMPPTTNRILVSPKLVGVALLLVLFAEAAFAQTVLPPVKSAGFPQVLCTALAGNVNSTSAMNTSTGFRSAAIACSTSGVATVTVIQSCDGTNFFVMSPSLTVTTGGAATVMFTIANPQCDYAVQLSGNAGTVTCTGWAGTRAP
jgi:hypothetical protein